MKNFGKNILLLVAVLSLSYLTASYVGIWYDKISYQGGSIFADRSITVPFAGFVASYIFFTPFVYGLFSIKQNKNWVIWLLSPALLLMLIADRYHLYIPIALIAIALALAWLIRFAILKFKSNHLVL